MQLDKLELITTPDYSGYTTENIGQVLSDLEVRDFNMWYQGATGVIHQVDPEHYVFLVYKHDFDRWSAGLPNND